MSDHEISDHPLSPEVQEMFDAALSEAAALQVINERRARYWMTNLAVKKRAMVLREYIGKINREDIKFLRKAPHAAEAIDELRKLAREVEALAFKLADREAS
jgi:hypothetical protein